MPSMNAAAAWHSSPWMSTLLVGQAEETPPPAKKSKLDIPEEEEEVPPKKPAPAAPPAATPPSTPPPASPPAKSKLDAPEEEEAPPAKKSAPMANAPEVEESPPKKPPLGAAPAAPAKAAEEGDEEEKATPVADTIYLNDRPIRIRLYPHILPFPLPSDQKNREFKFQLLIGNEEGKAVRSALGREMTRPVYYYEQRMWDQAAAVLEVKPEKLAEPGATFNASDPKMLKRFDLAERLLTTALAEHDSAVQQNLRLGTQWDARFRTPLLQALLNVRLSRVDHMIAQGQSVQAAAACDALLAEFKNSPVPPTLLRSRFEAIFLGQARQRFEEEDFAAARNFLDELAGRYPTDIGGPAREFREQFVKRAKALVSESESLGLAGKVRESLAALDKAALVWPELPDLDARRRQLGADYPLLDCAYSELPVNLSPLLARRPVERHAVSLLFESLVRWSDDPQMGPHYECRLALGRPIPLARGRQFQLPVCRWSDSTEEEPHLCTWADVRWTVKMMLENESIPGHLPALKDLVLDVVTSSDNDPFMATVRLKRDHWQPLSLMDFMVLPQRSFPNQGTPQELEQFNQEPVGTGPYKLAERATDQVRFVANPNYRVPGLPRIREITMHRLEPVQAVEAFLNDKIQLIYGLSPEHVNQLRQQGKTVKTLPSPSVWFLAPNYGHGKRKTQLANQNLRLAIAHGIDRQAILNQYFRPGRNSADHEPLTGPYPRSSWAYNTQAPEFDTSKARAYASTAKAELNEIAPIRLSYPAGDTATESACEQIKDQLAPVGITLELKPISPERFQEHIVDEHDFDLVYWRHDFEDETYWLWPLLDPDGIGPGGANFMAYHPDGDLLGFFQGMTAHKRFPEIKALTHKIHDHIARTAVVIPLWQLDTYVAVHASLKNATLDPVSLFGNVEQWNIQPKVK